MLLDPNTGTDGEVRPAIPFNPTAEKLAEHFYDFAVAYWPETTAVAVSETPKTWAYYDQT
jgi:hypothetical protein